MAKQIGYTIKKRIKRIPYINKYQTIDKQTLMAIIKTAVCPKL